MHGTNMYNDSYCGPCHTLGWNEVGMDGFDPGQDWNSSYNQDRWMIQCENCHGPASDHVAELSQQSINIDRDPYTACSGHGEAACHSGPRQWGSEEIPGWNQSAHAPWDDIQQQFPDMNTYCAQCKSPSQWDPLATNQDAEAIPPGEFRGITCGDCHNPHNVTGYIAQLRWAPEETCDTCHNGGHHETMRTDELAGVPSVNREDYPYMDEVACVDCHMWSTPHGMPEPYVKVGHSFEPNIEACLDCHTDIYNNTPDVDYDEGNPSAMAEWDA